MAIIKRFEDLECWQEARKLVRLIYKLTRRDPFRRDLELVGQVRGSAVSTMAHIAEAFHRGSNKDLHRFLDDSRSAAAETVSHCYVALDQSYIEKADLAEVNAQADTVWKKLNDFVAYLSRSSPKKIRAA